MKQIVERWPRSAAVLLGCLLSFGLVASIECFLWTRAWLTTPPSQAPLDSNISELVEPDPLLGFAPKNSTIFDETLTRGGAEVYRARYTLDEHRRRVTPVDHAEDRPCIALFFGCSFTFGTGVNDADTLPAQFGQHTGCFLPLNYGFSGYGPQNFWLQARNPALAGQLPNKRGIAVYTFVNDHVARLIGAPHVVFTWGARLPWLDEEDNRIVKRGTFADRFSATDWCAQWARSLHLYRFVMRRLPQAAHDPSETERAIDFTARVLADAGRNLRLRLPDVHVCFLAFPQATLGHEVIIRLAAEPILCLDYADYPGMANYPQADELHLKDGTPDYPGHPSPLLYRLVAERLAREVERENGGCCSK